MDGTAPIFLISITSTPSTSTIAVVTTQGGVLAFLRLLIVLIVLRLGSVNVVSNFLNAGRFRHIVVIVLRSGVRIPLFRLPEEAEVSEAEEEDGDDRIEHYFSQGIAFRVFSVMALLLPRLRCARNAPEAAAARTFFRWYITEVAIVGDRAFERIASAIP